MTEMNEKKMLFKVGDIVLTTRDLYVGDTLINEKSKATIIEVNENPLEFTYTFKTEDGLVFHDCFGKYLEKANVLPDFFIRPSEANIDSIHHSINSDMTDLKEYQRELHTIDKIIKGLNNRTHGGSIVISGAGTISTHSDVKFSLEDEKLDELAPVLMEILLERAKNLESKINTNRLRLKKVMSMYDIIYDRMEDKDDV